MNGLSFAARISLVWSFLWRGLAVGVLSTLAGGAAGFVAGFTLAAAGADVPTIQVVGGALGLVCGAVSWYGYVSWLLAGRLGRYRLQLVPVEGGAA